MSVYLGNHGYVALRRRSSGAAISATLRPADVNDGANRFALRIDEGALVTGDFIYVRNTAAANLDFVATSGWSDNQRHRDGNWFVNVDSLSGIRLYDSYAKAISGVTADAIDLTAPAANIDLTVEVKNKDYLPLGKCTSFELNTNRETIDTTALSDEYRSQHGALMSGSGRLEAQWSYRNATEQSNYLLQLALRTEIGGEFDARFYLKTANYNPEMAPGATDDEIFYEVSGVLTQVGVAFTPDAVVQVSADFVATGPIRLRVRTIAIDHLLQEDADLLLLDAGANVASGSILLESAE